MNDLRRALERATNRVEPTGRVPNVLREAARRRRQTRGLSAAVAVSTVVVSLVVVVQVVTGPPDVMRGPAGPTSSETPFSRTTAADPVLPPAQGPWDPRDVDSLPPDPARPGVLPEVLDPPKTAPPLADDPAPAVVVVMQDDDGAMLLGTDGRWRSLALPGESPRTELSPAGTRVLVWQYADGRGDTFRVVETASGRERSVSYPAGFVGADLTDWKWADERVAVLRAGTGGWRVETNSGDAERTNGPREPGWALDPAGEIVDGAVLAARGLARISASSTVVAGTSYTYGGPGFGVLTVGRGDRAGQVLAHLEVRDYDAIYSNFGLGTLAIADDGSVLLEVTARGSRTLDQRIVRWRPDTEALTLVSSVVVGATANARAVPTQSYAVGLLK